jgi:protein-S-isoprenylcysteine O-methyltransferase Ste14
MIGLMASLLSSLPWIELDAVGVAWLLFFLIFFARRRPSRLMEQMRDRRSVLGLLTQIAGYAIVRLGLRPIGVGFFGPESAVEVVPAFLSIAVLLASLMLSYASVRTLGQQWSLAARLLQGHKLIREGPYGLVRHPIYTAMLGMLLGSAVALSTWQALLAGTIVFLLGTAWRIRTEEHLLVEAFGDAYRQYSVSVPALIPGLHLFRSGPSPDRTSRP